MRIFKTEQSSIYIFTSRIIDVNTYCFIKDEEALLIDAVLCDELQEFLRSQCIKHVSVLLTHGHYDHILGLPAIKENFNVTVYCSDCGAEILENPKKNLSMFANLIHHMRNSTDFDMKTEENILPFGIKSDVILEDQKTFVWQELVFRIFSTPGHSKDSVCYVLENKYLFSGDSLLEMYEPVLRFPGGSIEEYEQYTKPFLQAVSKDVMVFPGHGKWFPVWKGLLYKE